MELIQTAKPFDDADWLFDVKYDGFRSLAYIENGTSRLVSRKEYDYKRFADLRDALPDEINAKNAMTRMTDAEAVPNGHMAAHRD